MPNSTSACGASCFVWFVISEDPCQQPPPCRVQQRDPSWLVLDAVDPAMKWHKPMHLLHLCLPKVNYLYTHNADDPTYIHKHNTSESHTGTSCDCTHQSDSFEGNIQDKRDHPLHLLWPNNHRRPQSFFWHSLSIACLCGSSDLLQLHFPKRCFSVFNGILS